MYEYPYDALRGALDRNAQDRLAWERRNALAMQEQLARQQNAYNAINDYNSRVDQYNTHLSQGIVRPFSGNVGNFDFNSIMNWFR